MERFRNQNRMQMPTFYGVEGTIVEMRAADAGMGNRTGCRIFVSVEDMNGNTVNFIVSPMTYVTDFLTIRLMCYRELLLQGDSAYFVLSIISNGHQRMG